MQKIILFLLSIGMLLPNFFKRDIIPVPDFDKKEAFDSHLSYINSVDLLEHYTDSIANSKNIQFNSYEYAELLESVVKKRFYHGFSHFTLSENWIAAISGKWINEGHACKIKPEDILQHSNAACSQQSIVMMAVLRNKRINYRMVGFPHHYALEIQDHQNWYFIDADMEPMMTKAERFEQSWQYQNDRLKKYYDTNRFNDLDYKFGSNVMAINGPINEIPAPNARFFQSVTFLLSKTLWCFPLLLMLFSSSVSFKNPLRFFNRRKPVPVSLAV